MASQMQWQNFEMLTRGKLDMLTAEALAYTLTALKREKFISARRRTAKHACALFIYTDRASSNRVEPHLARSGARGAEVRRGIVKSVEIEIPAPDSQGEP
jgi:hypothetical protein